MRNNRFMYVYLMIFVLLLGCGKKDGSAPSIEDYSSLQINPEAIIVPKSTTFKITVYGLKPSGSEDDITEEVTKVFLRGPPMLSNSPTVPLGNRCVFSHDWAGLAVMSHKQPV